MNRLDGCETIFYPDGSVRIKVTQKDYLCFDFLEVAILFKEAKYLIETGQKKAKIN